MGVLSKMSNPYKASSVLGKQQILKAIFPFDFEIVNEKCRTPRINEVLRLMLSVDGHSEKIKKGELFKNLELSLSVEPEGGFSNFLEGDIELLMGVDLTMP